MTPTTEQVQALREYARQHGRCWKSHLIESWMHGGAHGPLLQQVRNTFGPTWLRHMKLGIGNGEG